MPKNKILSLVVLFAILTSLFAANSRTAQGVVDHNACRPDGLYQTPGVTVPYCLAYDTEGRELMGSDHPRRLIGYFTAWRHGKDGQPSYLVNNIPWAKLTHINYAFAHIDSQNKISVGDVNDPNNPATGLQWPGIAGAEMNPALPYKGHFNLLTKYKALYPNVKTLISVGGWAETGGYFDTAGNRQSNGGFFALTVNADNTVNTTAINTFADSAVTFIRQYGFDGVDIDYEYPTSMNNAGNPLDWSLANPRRAALMAGYVALMQALRQKLDAASAQDGKYYLLSIASPSSGYLLRGMEAFQVTQYLDYVNIMSYDLHGAWNEFVGPNAALYDDGQDAELARWSVYTTAQYGGLGYLNTDWAYHYFRGAMPAGRINIGVPFYTRGWQNVTGGTNGLWGQSPSTNCSTGLTSCGNGARGIDNLWHDTENGLEMGAGSNPMWHAKNLENGINPSYLSTYGLNPAQDPEDQFVGTYTRYYNATLVAPWLWNPQKKVFLSTEDAQSLQVKTQYVVDKGIGGLMFWELAGDYAWDATRNNGQGEYFMGNTLVSQMYNQLKTAPAYGHLRAEFTLPTQALDVRIALTNFPVGDSNYPISPKLKITNASTTTIPGGAEFQFNYSTSAPNNAKDQSGFGLTVFQTGHSGNNIGGLTGNYHRARFTLPTWQSLAPGAEVVIDYVYYLPAPLPANWTLTFGGQSYRLAFEQARGGSVTPNVTATPTVGGPTATRTNTAPPPTATNTSGPTATPTNTSVASATATPTAVASAAACTAPAWNSTATYNANALVSHAAHQWRAKWWTQNETPGTTGQWGVWEDLGLCNGGATATPLPPTATNPPATATPLPPTRTPTAPVPTATVAPATATNSGTCSAPAWSSTAIYLADNLVSHAGHQWRAKWWTQNETPGTTGEWGVWQDLGICSN